MTETPVDGPVPRYELATWRDELGVVAGITGTGDSGTPFDLGLAQTGPAGAMLDRWGALRRAVPGFRGIVVSRQVHDIRVLWHDETSGLGIHEGFDGHATTATGLLLAVTAADCIPIYLVDPVRRAVALLHAGWRGTAAGILEAGLNQLVRRGSNVENVLVHCGVGICGSCYQVGSEVFAGCGLPAPETGRGNLDLRNVLVQQARGHGVDSVSTSPFCSKHDPGFFSHRGGHQGRMVAYLGLLR